MLSAAGAGWGGAFAPGGVPRSSTPRCLSDTRPSRRSHFSRLSSQKRGRVPLPGALAAQGKAAPERSSLSPGGFPFPPLARGLLEGQSHLRCRLRVGLVGFSGLELALGKATQ